MLASPQQVQILKLTSSDAGPHQTAVSLPKVTAPRGGQSRPQGWFANGKLATSMDGEGFFIGLK